MADVTQQTAVAPPELPGNYYTQRGFFRTDVASGVTTSRSGYRTLALTDDFLLGFLDGFVEECGPATDMILKSCGKYYGERLHRRFRQDMEMHFGAPMDDMPLAYFNGNLAEFFSIHGWGRPFIDWNNFSHGVVVIQVARTPVGEMLGKSDNPGDHLLAGIYAGFFGSLADEPLGCVQTQAGNGMNRFIVALDERLEGMDEAIADGLRHEDLLDRLCQ